MRSITEGVLRDFIFDRVMRRCYLISPLVNLVGLVGEAILHQMSAVQHDQRLFALIAGERNPTAFEAYRVHTFNRTERARLSLRFETTLKNNEK